MYIFNTFVKEDKDNVNKIVCTISTKTLTVIIHKKLNIDY